MNAFVLVLAIFMWIVYIEDSKYEHYVVMGVIWGEDESDRDIY